MQRLARQRLKSVFRECGKSYSKTASRLGINRGTVYAILVWHKRVSRRVMSKLNMEIPPPARRKNWKRKCELLNRYILKRWKNERDAKESSEPVRNNTPGEGSIET